jgi:hypothetical protein
MQGAPRQPPTKRQGATMRRAGIPRGMPWTDGEQATRAQKAASHATHGNTREGMPWADGEQATPAQK